MSLTFTDVDVPTDTPQEDTLPSGLSDVEYPCEVCNKEAGPYGGRGRKPKRCEDHKKPSTTRAPKVTGTAASLAAQATESLWQMNGFAAIGCMFVQMNDTAGTILSKEETFRNQVYSALLTDQDLCRSILRGGVKGAKVGLALAYLGFLASVAPVAVAEFRELAEERKARKAERLAAEAEAQ